ncbi:hypothetical protein V3C33_07680 [Micrococcaceae bacterium Sec5.7]
MAAEELCRRLSEDGDGSAAAIRELTPGLEQTAEHFSSPGSQASAFQARGAVILAAGHPEDSWKPRWNIPMPPC